MFNRLIAFFRSFKLTFFLLGYFILTSIMISFIPQGLKTEVYQKLYSFPFLNLFLFLGFDHFYSSYFFIIPLLLFFVNLATCSITRFLKRKKGLSFAPDIIHLGLLVLITGGFISFFTKQEQVVTLSQGEQQIILGNYMLKLEQFSYDYSSHVPGSWQSKVILLTDERQEGPFTVKVNNPLSFRQVKIYQYSWDVKQYLYLKDDTGEIYRLEPGQGFFMEEYYYLFDGFKEEESRLSEPQKALFLFWQEGKQPEQLTVTKGDRLSSFEVYNLGIVPFSWLKVVIDYSMIVVYCSFVITGLGIFLFLIQKMKRIKHREV